MIDWRRDAALSTLDEVYATGYRMYILSAKIPRLDVRKVRVMCFFGELVRVRECELGNLI